jgi:hypothetical protein
MSIEKQKLDPRDVHIARERSSNAGGKYANRYEIAAVAQFRYIDIVAVTVGVPFAIILKE